MHSSSISRLTIFLGLVVAVSATPSIVSRATPSVVARGGSPQKPAHAAHKALKQFDIRTTPTQGMKCSDPSDTPKPDGIFERAIDATVNVARRFVYEDSARRQVPDGAQGLEVFSQDECGATTVTGFLGGPSVPEGEIPAASLTQ